MRKLWNRSDDAVWSLSTLSKEGVQNMNICTYVTAVSLNPKLMMVAVYKNTQTLQNIVVGEKVLLQLLPVDLAPAVRICGQKSGKDIDKIGRLKKNYELLQVDGLSYFKESAGFMVLEVEQLVETSGDHELMVGRVTKATNTHEKTILTTTYLKAHGYIR